MGLSVERRGCELGVNGKWQIQMVNNGRRGGYEEGRVIGGVCSTLSRTGYSSRTIERARGSGRTGRCRVPRRCWKLPGPLLPCDWLALWPSDA